MMTPSASSRCPPIHSPSIGDVQVLGGADDEDGLGEREVGGVDEWVVVSYIENGA